MNIPLSKEELGNLLFHSDDTLTKQRSEWLRYISNFALYGCRHTRAVIITEELAAKIRSADTTGSLLIIHEVPAPDFTIYTLWLRADWIESAYKMLLQRASSFERKKQIEKRMRKEAQMDTMSRRWLAALGGTLSEARFKMDRCWIDANESEDKFREHIGILETMLRGYKIYEPLPNDDTNEEAKTVAGAETPVAIGGKDSEDGDKESHATEQTVEPVPERVGYTAGCSIGGESTPAEGEGTVGDGVL